MFNEATRERLAQLYFRAHGIADRAAAWHEAVVALGRTVHEQASIMG